MAVKLFSRGAVVESAPDNGVSLVGIEVATHGVADGAGGNLGGERVVEGLELLFGNDLAGHDVASAVDIDNQLGRRFEVRGIDLAYGDSALVEAFAAVGEDDQQALVGGDD